MSGDRRANWVPHTLGVQDHLLEYERLSGRTFKGNPDSSSANEGAKESEETVIVKPSSLRFRAGDIVCIDATPTPPMGLCVGGGNTFQGELPPFEVVIIFKGFCVQEGPQGRARLLPPPAAAGLHFLVARTGETAEEPDPALWSEFERPSRLEIGGAFRFGRIWRGLPKHVRVEASATSADFFSGPGATFEVNLRRKGDFLRVEARVSSVHPLTFSPPKLVEIDTFKRVFVVEYQLPRVRDVSDEVLKRLRRAPVVSVLSDPDPPDGLTSDAPPRRVSPMSAPAERVDFFGLTGKPPIGLPLVADPPVNESSGDLQRAAAEFAPFDEKVLELGPIRASSAGGSMPGSSPSPRVVGVAWPKACYRKDGESIDSRPLSFYLSLREPGYWSEFPYPKSGQSPESWGWDCPYLQLALPMSYMENPTRDGYVPRFPSGAHLQEPLLRHIPTRSGRGYPWQLAASKKPVVLVVPAASTEDGSSNVGGLLDGQRLELIFNEIQCAFEGALLRGGQATLRDGGCRPIEGFGVSVFSSGEVQGRVFLQIALGKEPDDTYRAYANNTGFIKEKLREVVLFDPPFQTSGARQLLELALEWRNARKRGDPPRCVRLYSQSFGEQALSVIATCERLLSTPNAPVSLPQPQSDLAWSRHSADGEVSVVYVPLKAWERAQLARYPFDPADARPAAAKVAELRRNVRGMDFGSIHQMIPAFFLIDALRRSKLV